MTHIVAALPLQLTARAARESLFRLFEKFARQQVRAPIRSDTAVAQHDRERLHRAPIAPREIAVERYFGILCELGLHVLRRGRGQL